MIHNTLRLKITYRGKERDAGYHLQVGTGAEEYESSCVENALVEEERRVQQTHCGFLLQIEIMSHELAFPRRSRVS